MNPLLFRLFRANETKVHELNYLFWECTTRCMLRCRHCGSDCSVQSREKDMPLEDFLRALDTIPADHRPRDFSVVLTGGEPLLRPDIAEAGREIRRRGFGWGMVTNGWCYDEAMHGKLMSAGMGAITVSLDGLEASHDWMRGVPGSYQRALRAIGIIAAEPRLNADVVTCVNRRNLAELPEIYEILKGLGVKLPDLLVTPINQLAAVSVTEARTLTIQPWDVSVLKQIEKAIQMSEVGINPQNDGKIIRLIFPPLTEDKRKEIAKDIAHIAEDSKVQIRNVRRDTIEKLKKMKKDGELTEDDLKEGEKKVQKSTDNFIKEIDSIADKKKKEIMEI